MLAKMCVGGGRNPHTLLAIGKVFKQDTKYVVKIIVMLVRKEI
jgi:hypothetical protein